MRYALVSSCAVVMACSARALEGEDGEDEDSVGIGIGEDSTGTDDTQATQGTEGDPDPSGCDPSECADLCAETRDECWFSFDGVCTDDVCVCEPPSAACLPCGSAGPCLEWETCYEEFSLDGECQLQCGYDFEFSWDADIGCVIQLDLQLPASVFPAWYVHLDGMTIMNLPGSNDAGCAPPETWLLDAEQRTLTLCPSTCALFEETGALNTGWAISCE